MRKYEGFDTVKVTCHDNIEDKLDFLDLYFNHEQKSGGYDVVEHFADTTENVAYFKFKSSDGKFIFFNFSIYIYTKFLIICQSLKLSFKCNKSNVMHILQKQNYLFKLNRLITV